MNDRIRYWRWMREGVFRHIKVGCEGIEDLTRVGQVGLERVDIGVIEGNEVEVEHLMALGKKVRYSVLASFAGTTSENDAHDGDARRLAARSTKRSYIHAWVGVNPAI
jgi:hypothetical protein